MFGRFLHSNEIIGLAVMLLLALALLASQSDAGRASDAKAATVLEQSDGNGYASAPLTATIKGHINGKVLKVSIDTLGHFGLFRVERKPL